VFSIRPGVLCSYTNTDAEVERPGSDKCGGIPMDSLITAAAFGLAA
jgi:hypothetical protein